MLMESLAWICMDLKGLKRMVHTGHSYAHLCKLKQKHVGNNWILEVPKPQLRISTQTTKSPIQHLPIWIPDTLKGNGKIITYILCPFHFSTSSFNQFHLNSHIIYPIGEQTLVHSAAFRKKEPWLASLQKCCTLSPHHASNHWVRC